MAGIPIGLIIKCLVANKFFIPSEKQGFRFFFGGGGTKFVIKWD